MLPLSTKGKCILHVFFTTFVLGAWGVLVHKVCKQFSA